MSILIHSTLFLGSTCLHLSPRKTFFYLSLVEIQIPKFPYSKLYYDSRHVFCRVQFFVSFKWWKLSRVFVWLCLSHIFVVWFPHYCLGNVTCCYKNDSGEVVAFSMSAKAAKAPVSLIKFDGLLAFCKQINQNLPFNKLVMLLYHNWEMKFWRRCEISSFSRRPIMEEVKIFQLLLIDGSEICNSVIMCESSCKFISLLLLALAHISWFNSNLWCIFMINYFHHHHRIAYGIKSVQFWKR